MRRLSFAAIAVGNLVQIAGGFTLQFVLGLLVVLTVMANPGAGAPTPNLIHETLTADTFAFITFAALIVTTLIAGYVAALIARQSPWLHGALASAVLTGLTAALVPYTWLGGHMPKALEDQPVQPGDQEAALALMYIIYALPLLGVAGAYIRTHVPPRSALRWIAALVVGWMAFNATFNMLFHIVKDGSMATLATVVAIVAIVAGVFAGPPDQRVWARNILVGLFIAVPAIIFAIAEIDAAPNAIGYGLLGAHIAAGCVIVLVSMRNSHLRKLIGGGSPGNA